MYVYKFYITLYIVGPIVTAAVVTFHIDTIVITVTWQVYTV